MALPGLSFLPGLQVQEEIWQRFRLPVTCPSRSASAFSLVVAFGRCKFRLSPAFVGSLLQATIGGEASHFDVFQL
jgi:hypothetical protein